jgi:SAM-dependent methyltransferase
MMIKTFLSRGEIIMLKNLITRTYQRYKRYRGFGIKKTDITLDIGSGPHPFYRADILLDISIEGSRKDERPFVQADICNLPFHDKSIDFIYCSHALEHVNNPEKALNEIQRVGRRGYIAVPSALWETLFGDDREHKWLIEQKENQLIFTPKDEIFFSRSETARNSMQKLFELNPKIMGTILLHFLY